MEDNKVLHKSFANLAVAIATLNGGTFKKAKQLVIDNFESHPYSKIIKSEIDKTEISKENIDTLFEDCVRICEEFGPNRDYLTLVLMLESIKSTKSKLAQANKKDEITLIVKKFRKEINRINKVVPAPPLYNILLEGRAALEWSSIFYIYPFIPKRNKGQNKPVLLIPPYLGNDLSTSFVRRYLKSLGFKTYKWDLGVNMIRSSYIPKLIEKLDEIFETHQEKVSLVGWSGGGMFAKILANRYPDKVEQIITIGSPIWGIMELQTSINGLFEFLRGKSLKERNERFLNEVEAIPKVPITCIYTKTDGVVPWKNCMEAATHRDNIKNIEVYGSHSGMGANATVLVSVANSLISNIEGKKAKRINTKIEDLFFPKFWKKKENSKMRSLIIKT